MTISVSWSTPGEFSDPLFWIAHATGESSESYAFWNIVMLGFGLFICFHAD